MNREIRMEDGFQNRLTLCMEKSNSGWKVYARHSKIGRGATTMHREEQGATRALAALALAARGAGWELRVECRQTVNDPARMTIDENGERVFYDRHTGAPFRDESALRPSTASPIVWSSLVPAGRPADEFGAGSLPAPLSRP